jgi:plasmid stability protein
VLKSRHTGTETLAWEAVVKRAGGRRRWLGVRRLRARMRRHRLVCLCAEEGISYGCRVRWAKRLGVSPATITADLHWILRQHPPEPGPGSAAGPASGRPRRRVHRRQGMSSRVTVRLPRALQEDLQRRAAQHGQSLSQCIRHHLATAATPAEPSAPPSLPRDVCAEAILHVCPPEVQAQLRQAVERTGLSLFDVIRAFLITAVPR